MSVSEELYAVNVETAVYRAGEYLLVERAADEEHAAGALALVGGTVETNSAGDVLERTARRELREEVGVDVTDLQYVQSNAFVAEDGTPCVNVVMLARYDGGEVTVREPDEVASIQWLEAGELPDHPSAPEWTTAFVERAEHLRRSLGWT